MKMILEAKIDLIVLSVKLVGLLKRFWMSLQTKIFYNDQRLVNSSHLLLHHFIAHKNKLWISLYWVIYSKMNVVNLNFNTSG